MAKRSKYQERVIRNYYKNRDTISLQRLQELVTELYLTEGKKRASHWKSVVGGQEKLGIKPPRIEHLLNQDDPVLVAKLVEELMNKI